MYVAGRSSREISHRECALSCPQDGHALREAVVPDVLAGAPWAVTHRGEVWRLPVCLYHFDLYPVSLFLCLCPAFLVSAALPHPGEPLRVAEDWDPGPAPARMQKSPAAREKLLRKTVPIVSYAYLHSLHHVPTRRSTDIGIYI